MSALNVSAITFGGRVGDEDAERQGALLSVVLERSGFVACVTDIDGLVQWASPAFVALVRGDGDPIGRSLFDLAGGRAATLRGVLRAVVAAPLHAASVDVDLGDPQAGPVRVSAENLCSDPDVEGVLWWQCRARSPERVDRLSRALANIAQEVEWVGFTRRQPASDAAAIGLLPGAERLSDRERSVATMLAQGDSVADIAARIFVSPSTVRNYLSAMYRKLGVRDLAALRELLARGGTAALRAPGPSSAPQ
jgi:DNA-binding CsgD family transcriptional regulator